MPQVGSKQRMVAGVGGDPAGDGDLLLVAAGEALHLALGAGVDLQPNDGAADAASLAAARIGPQSRAGR